MIIIFCYKGIRLLLKYLNKLNYLDSINIILDLIDKFSDEKNLIIRLIGFFFIKYIFLFYILYVVFE